MYQALKAAVRGQIGRFRVESLQCCIHFVSAITFTAVRIFKDKLRVEFSLNREIKSKRIKRRIQMSARRYLYFVDVIKQEEIDKDLMGWLRQAYEPA